MRELVVRQTQLPFIAATGTANTVTTVTDVDELGRFADNELIGAHVYLPDATFKHRRATDNVQSTGVVTFIPSATANNKYEILPWPADAIHDAIIDSLTYAYDRGILVRKFWVKAVTGSPIYNGDLTYWTSSALLDGWTATTTTLSRLTGDADKFIGERAARLGTANGTVALAAPWRRFLSDFASGTVTLRAWVRCTRIGVARINIVGDGFTTASSSHHSGDGDWELLSISVSLGDGSINFYPELERSADTADADFGEVWIEGSHTPDVHPFPIDIAPYGPKSIYIGPMGVNETNLRANVNPRNLRPWNEWRWLRYHEETTNKEIGLIVWTKQPPAGYRMWIEVDGPVTAPTADTDILELNTIEAILIAKMAALKLIEQKVLTASALMAQKLLQTAAQLARDVERLSEGKGAATRAAPLPKW
jgi:hypothetical protein